MNNIHYQNTTPEWRHISEIVLQSIAVFVFCFGFLYLIFRKPKTTRIERFVEVDPFQPHSITITFLPNIYSVTENLLNQQLRNIDDDTDQNNFSAEAA